MDVPAPDEEARIARLRRTGPQHRPGRMGERRLGQVGTLKILVVNRESQQGGELFLRLRAVDVDCDLDAVAHGHQDVLFCDHAGVGWRSVIVDRRPVAGQRELKRAIGRLLLRHHVLDGRVDYPRKQVRRSRQMSLASMRMKAMRHGSLPRLTQAWIVPCCTSTSPALRWTSESSSSMSISPASTMA
jgi:hypothetical protein